MGIEWGPRGYPGGRGLTGFSGPKGDKGDAGVAGATGADGATPVEGVDYFDGNTGDYTAYVFASVVTGTSAPTITPGTGSYSGTTEVMPTGSVTWYPTPFTAEGYTTYVAVNRYVHDATTGGNGTWTLKSPFWSSPEIFTAIQGEVQGRVVSYAFTRSATQPATPDGGSYASPNPTTIGWEDGIPTGTATVYMSKRLFTEDGGTPQDATWTTPRILGANGSGTKFQFSSSEFGPWHDIPLPTDEWMIVCTKDESGNWTCDTGNPVRIKGETGDTAQSKFKAFAFKRSNTALLERPTGGDFDSPAPVDGVVTGWTTNIPLGTSDLYVSNRLFTTDGLPPEEALWSISELFSGQNAYSFVIQTDSHVVSFDSDDEPLSPDQVNFTALKQNIDDDVNWTTNPAGALTYFATSPNLATDTFYFTKEEFNTATDTLGVVAIKIIATAGSLTDEITIAKIGDGYTPVPGVDYSDGQSIFQSKIFKSAPEGTPPATPTGGSYDGTTEVVPTGWSEDPIAPATAGDAVWESNFVYLASQINGVNTWDDASQPTGGGSGGTGTGGPWSTPIQYFYVPQEGVDFFSGNSFQSYVFKNEAVGTPVTAPTDGSISDVDDSETLPVGWSDDPVTPADNEVTWITGRLYTKTGTTWNTPYDAWSTPAEFSGSATLTGVLTNETDMVSSDANGENPIFIGDEGGEFLVYFGNLDVTSDCTFTVEGGADSGANHVKTQNLLTMSIVKATGVYSLSGADWDATDRETFTLRATHGTSGFIARKTYSLSKSIEGAIGVSGTANRLDIAYSSSSDGTTGTNWPPNASSTGKEYIGTNVITWIPPATEPVPSEVPGDYEWSLMTGDDGADGQSSRIDFIYADNVTTNPPTIVGHVVNANFSDPVTANEWLGTNVVTWTPPASEPAVDTNVLSYEWTKFRGDDGSDGTDSLSVVLSNASHTIPTDVAGANGDYTGSGTTIKMFEGATEATFITATSPTYPATNGEWRIHSVTDTNISSGSITDSGTYATVADASGFTTGVTPLTASSTFNIKGRSSGGTTYDIAAQQSFNKNLAGGPPAGQITVTGTGTVTAGSGNISVAHPSAGNNISVIWQFRLRGSGTDEPSATTDIELRADGTVISTVAFDIIEEFTEPSNFWIAFKTSATYVHTNAIEDTIDFTITMANAGSYDTPTVDYAVITTVEEL